MKSPENEIVVLDVAGKRAMIACGKSAEENHLLTLGFSYEGIYMVRAIADDVDRQNIVCELVRMGALFSSGRDWSPAEIVDLYREQGIVKTSYQVITWRNPDDYLVITR